MSHVPWMMRACQPQNPKWSSCFHIRNSWEEWDSNDRFLKVGALNGVRRVSILEKTWQTWGKGNATSDLLYPRFAKHLVWMMVQATCGSFDIIPRILWGGFKGVAGSRSKNSFRRWRLITLDDPNGWIRWIGWRWSTDWKLLQSDLDCFPKWRSLLFSRFKGTQKMGPNHQVTTWRTWLILVADVFLNINLCGSECLFVKIEFISNIILFSPRNYGEMIPFLTSICLQIGWFNHQPENLWQAGAQVLITCRDPGSFAEPLQEEIDGDVAVLTCLGRFVAAVEKGLVVLGVPGEGISPSDEFIYYMLPGVVFFCFLCAWEGILSHLFFFSHIFNAVPCITNLWFSSLFWDCHTKSKAWNKMFFFFFSEEGETEGAGFGSSSWRQ